MPSGIPPTKHHRISLDDAQRKLAPLLGKNGGTFNRDIFDAILKDKNCKGIRFYFAMANGSDIPGSGIEFQETYPTIIIIGVDDQGKDMLNEFEDPDDGGKLKLLSGGENSWPNPPHGDSVDNLGTMK